MTVNSVRPRCPATGRLLEVDRCDAYFFDHELDHLPGMVLVSGMFDLARSTGMGTLETPGRRLTLVAEFPRFCELDAPVDMRPRGRPPTLSAWASQNGEAVFTGLCATHPEPPTIPVQSGMDYNFVEAAEPDLVHRRDPGNVLISRMAKCEGAWTVAIREPGPGHRLATTPFTPYRAETLVDAARQFVTMICHTVHDTPMDSRFVLTRIDGDWPGGLCSPSFLRWIPQAPQRGRRRTEFELVTGGPGAPVCGRLAFEYFTMSPAGYRRLRRQSAPV